jgi:hypothetical protein
MAFQRPKRINPFVRALIEVGSIVFLFFSNLLMGEYNRSGQGRVHGLLWALQDIFTLTNILIAFSLAFIGYGIFELLRRRL